MNRKERMPQHRRNSQKRKLIPEIMALNGGVRHRI
jgi:hypothetical protein